MTFSIIAYDPTTDSWGIAVASRIFAIGSTVPYAKWNWGIVASQGLVPNFGDRILYEVLTRGDIENAFAEYISKDPYSQHRQIAFIDREGNNYNYDGDKLVPIAGSISSKYVSVQGNMLANYETLEVMLETYQNDTDNPDFGDRLLNALEAGEKVGGDRRIYNPGYSATLLIVQPQTDCSIISSACKIDLRIDNSKTPIQDLMDLYQKSKFEVGDIIL